jgi:hypothetical protein
VRKIAFTVLAAFSVMLGCVIPASVASAAPMTARPFAASATAAARALATGAARALATGTDPGADTSTPSLSGSRVSCGTAKNCLAVTENLDGAGNSTPAADAWNGTAWQPLALPLPTGAGGSLNGVSCKQASCLAVGYYSTTSGDHPVALKWNGKSLTQAATPPLPAWSMDATLADVSCVTAASCVAIGSGTTSAGTTALIIDTWNGATWAMRTVALPASMLGVTVNGLSCATASYCAAGGMFATASPGASGSFGLWPLLVTWNGKAIGTKKLPAPPGASLAMISDVSCVSVTSCAATGITLSPALTSSNGFVDVLAGTAWKTASIAWPRGAASSELMAVSCPSPASCVAVGVDGLTNSGAADATALTYNGKTWTVQNNVPGPGSGEASLFGGVSCVTATYCAASGLTGRASGNAAIPLNGVWNGKSWKLSRLP